MKALEIPPLPTPSSLGISNHIALHRLMDSGTSFERALGGVQLEKLEAPHLTGLQNYLAKIQEAAATRLNLINRLLSSTQNQKPADQ